MMNCLDKVSSVKFIPSNRKNTTFFSILSQNQTKDLLKLNKNLLQNHKLRVNN